MFAVETTCGEPSFRGLPDTEIGFDETGAFCRAESISGSKIRGQVATTRIPCNAPDCETTRKQVTECGVPA